MIKLFRILFSSLAVLVILFSCSLSVLASDIEPGELPGSTVETYPEDLPVFFNETGIVILSQPTDFYGQLGDQASLSVVAIGEITSYQWQFARANSSNWTDCTSTTLGYNTSVVQPVLTEMRDGYRYRCIISNSLGFVVSDFATIRIGDKPGTDSSVSDSASVSGYLDWFLTFVSDGIAWMGAQYIVSGISLLHFIIAVGVLCIVVGGLLIR